MSRESELNEQWRLPSLDRYYDFGGDALARHAARLAELGESERSGALAVVEQVVRAQAGGLDDALLPKVAVSVVDDLYKTGCALADWGPAHGAYVTAVWGTFFGVLAGRGFTMRYVVDNCFPESLQRPLELFPALFGRAGITYVCPHRISLELPEAAGVEQSVEGLQPLIVEARVVAGALVEDAVAQGRHLAYVELDYVEGCLDTVNHAPAAPGTIKVFRNEPGIAGTSVHVAVVPKG